nr:glutathione S-transferase zeta class-like [Ipomoea batatas]
MGLVPALVDGDFVISDSFAILMYLEDKYPQHPLLPIDLQRKAINFQAANIVSANIQPLQNISVSRYIAEKFGPDEKLRWTQAHILKGFDALESLLKDYAGKYATGDELYLADVFLAPQIHAAVKRFSVDMLPGQLIIVGYVWLAATFFNFFEWNPAFNYTTSKINNAASSVAKITALCKETFIEFSQFPWTRKIPHTIEGIELYRCRMRKSSFLSDDISFELNPLNFGGQSTISAEPVVKTLSSSVAAWASASLADRETISVEDVERERLRGVGGVRDSDGDGDFVISAMVVVGEAQRAF